MGGGVQGSVLHHASAVSRFSITPPQTLVLWRHTLKSFWVFYTFYGMKRISLR